MTWYWIYSPLIIIQITFWKERCFYYPCKVIHQPKCNTHNYSNSNKTVNVTTPITKFVAHSNPLDVETFSNGMNIMLPFVVGFVFVIAWQHFCCWGYCSVGYGCHMSWHFCPAWNKQVPKPQIYTSFNLDIKTSNCKRNKLLSGILLQSFYNLLFNSL